MGAVMQPCDAGVISCTRGAAPCHPASGPWVIAAASLGSGMAFLDSTVMNVALPAVQTNLDVSGREVQWMFGAFGLVIAALLLLGGTLGDHYGRRRIFVFGASIFAAASVGCALAAGPTQLIAARAVQGVGGALLVPASLAIVGASFEGRARAKAIGLWGALSGMAMAVGPVLGGWLVTDVSWRAAFLISPAMALVAIPIALWHVPESRDPEARGLDLVGAAIVTIALGALVYGLIESSASGFADPVVLAALLLGAFALSTFVFVERRENDPMVPPSLFRSKNFDGANLVTLLFYMSLTGSLYFVPFPDDAGPRLLGLRHRQRVLALRGDGPVARAAERKHPGSLRGEDTAHNSFARRCAGIRAVLRAWSGARLLLDLFLPRDGRSGLRDGAGDNPTHHGGARLGGE